MEPDAGSNPQFLPQLRLDELLSELQSRLQVVLAARDQMRGLLEAVIAISSGLDLESTLRRIVETAVRLVDATCGALGVIGDGRLAEFIPVGLTQEEIAKIDHWPEGHGLLGLLIKEPQPLRLASISGHAESSGFPRGSVDAVTAWEYPAGVGGFGWSPGAAFAVSDLASVADKTLRDAVDEVQAKEDGVTVRRLVREGYPARVLMDAADGADLLVVGSRGHGGFAGLLLGSVSAHCVHHAPCPVLVIRGQVDH